MLTERARRKPSGLCPGGEADVRWHSPVQPEGLVPHRLRTVWLKGERKRVAVIPPAYTSQECSGDVARLHTSLSLRIHHDCTFCGLVLDRDEHAARNIQRARQALRGVPVLPAALTRAPVWLSHRRSVRLC